MPTKTNQLPKVSRPGEYVAFFTMKVSTMQGPAFVYMACDAFTGFGFNTGVELNENPESIVKHVYLLTEHPDFVRHMDKGFTLVFDRFEELSERINAMITPIKGKVLFDEKFHNQIAQPFINSFGHFAQKPRL